MKVCACFLLFTIFEYTLSVKTVQQNPQQDPRSVNLALETVLEFREKDKAADLKFLDNVQNFITKVKTVIDKNGKTTNLRRDFKTTQGATFTGFVQDVVQILNTYDDNALIEFFKILDDEARKYHYRGCKFYELTDNYETRKFLASKFDLIKGKPAPVIKTYINIVAEALKEEIYDEKVRELVDYINSLYNKDSEKMFEKVFSGLERHSKSTKKDYNDFVKVIREGIRSTIFDRYSKLHPNARKELINKIEMFWKTPKGTITTTTKRNDIFYSKFVNNIKTTENTVTEEENSIITKKETKPTTNKNIEIKKQTSNKSEAARILIKESDYKKPIVMRDGSPDEKKRYKYTRSTNIVHIPLNDKEVSIPTTKSDHELRAKYKTSDESSKAFGSKELSQKSFESNSIEFSQELQREYNTKRYMTLYPEEISRRSTTKKKHKIVHRAEKRTTKKYNLQTLWIEESTGRIPKSVLKKLSTKPKPKSNTKHTKKDINKNESQFETKKLLRYGKKSKSNHEKKANNHDKKIDKKHGKTHKKKVLKHVVKHESKPMHHEKHAKRTKSDRKEFIFEQNEVRSTNMELFKFKKMMGPLTVEYKPDITKLVPSKSTKSRARTKPSKATKPPLPRRHKIQTKQSTSELPPIPPRAKPQRRPMELLQKTSFKKIIKATLATAPSLKGRRHNLPGKKFIHYRKSAESLLSDEGLSIEQFVKERKAQEKSLRRSGSSEKDPSVIKRINELEKELQDFKSKISNITVSGLTIPITTAKYELKVTEKDTNKNTDLKTQGPVVPYVPMLKKDGVKLTGTAQKVPQYKTEFMYVKGKDSVFREDDFEIDNKTNLQETLKDNKTNINSKNIANSKVNMNVAQSLNGDANYDSLRNPKFDHNYDEVDVWKEAINFDRIKATKSTPTKATKPSPTTTKSTTTVRTTASLATPAKISTIVNVTSLKSLKYMINAANTTVVIKNVPETTAQSASTITKTILNATTIQTVVNREVINNNKTFPLGVTFYKTVETPASNNINTEDDSTPSAFYRRADDAGFMDRLTQLANNFLK